MIGKFRRHIYIAILKLLALAFPPVPFTATVKVGANVYSPATGIKWGTVQSGSEFTRVTVVSLFGDRAKIGSPLWDGKQWATEQSNLTAITEPSPTEVHPVSTEFELSDGTRWQSTNFTKL